MKQVFAFLVWIGFSTLLSAQAFIRINQMGYLPEGSKVAVLCLKGNIATLPISFEVVSTRSGKVVFHGNTGKDWGSYGPFQHSWRLSFSKLQKAGSYQIRCAGVLSPTFRIGSDVFEGASDFCLRYMRQQRSGFNPFLKDSCHTYDGFTLYGPMPDSTHIDVTGGWHDASDYLQYSTTSANATYHLLAAYRDFPDVFSDQHQANGLDGVNGEADVLDEARWGLTWLQKMNPADDLMFNQLGDDRDHVRMRMPGLDTNYYAKGFERPVYFCSGKPQVRGKFMNQATGTASTAGKFSSAFALAASIYAEKYPELAALFRHKATAAYQFGQRQPGVCQTASVKSPYIYAEGNWTDDMELAAAWQDRPEEAFTYAEMEKITPWLGRDTAHHYEWYPFINVGHYELAKRLRGAKRDSILSWYREGIEAVWKKASQNAFYRGVPFIWCSNNLTTSFAIQCYWYRQLSGDKQFIELEQANFDWLFGCNPWGTSMVYGLPAGGDTPVDPHSAFTHLKNYPIDGGLVDGPVYTQIFKNLIGIQLMAPDEYADFQSDLAVYHDDYGDYSTNEPTMDGTASLIYLLAAQEQSALSQNARKSSSASRRGRNR